MVSVIVILFGREFISERLNKSSAKTDSAIASFEIHCELTAVLVILEGALAKALAAAPEEQREELRQSLIKAGSESARKLAILKFTAAENLPVSLAVGDGVAIHKSFAIILANSRDLAVQLNDPEAQA